MTFIAPVVTQLRRLAGVDLGVIWASVNNESNQRTSCYSWYHNVNSLGTPSNGPLYSITVIGTLAVDGWLYLRTPLICSVDRDALDVTYATQIHHTAAAMTDGPARVHHYCDDGPKCDVSGLDDRQMTAMSVCLSVCLSLTCCVIYVDENQNATHH